MTYLNSESIDGIGTGTQRGVTNLVAPCGSTVPCSGGEHRHGRWKTLGLFLVTRESPLPTASGTRQSPAQPATKRSSSELCVPKGNFGRLSYAFFPEVFFLLLPRQSESCCCLVTDKTQLRIRGRTAVRAQDTKVLAPCCR